MYQQSEQLHLNKSSKAQQSLTWVQHASKVK